MFTYSNIINVSLTYLRGLEIVELKEEDMPMVYCLKRPNLRFLTILGLEYVVYKLSPRIIYFFWG